MAEIKAYHSKNPDLTLFIVAGSVSAEDLIAAMETHYGARPASIAVWDLWEADLSGLDMAALVKVSDVARGYARNRKDPRTLFAVKREQEKPLVRLYEKISELRGSPISYEMLPSRAAAYQHLGLNDPFAAADMNHKESA
ncbi:MAG TPA: hypothetical protein EYP07_03960 [Kiloniellaceae bacterium]|nr:hypothetical protein [Kiloniellaceae bacterium]